MASIKSDRRARRLARREERNRCRKLGTKPIHCPNCGGISIFADNEQAGEGIVAIYECLSETCREDPYFPETDKLKQGEYPALQRKLSQAIEASISEVADSVDPVTVEQVEQGNMLDRMQAIHSAEMNILARRVRCPDCGALAAESKYMRLDKDPQVLLFYCPNGNCRKGGMFDSTGKAYSFNEYSYHGNQAQLGFVYGYDGHGEGFPGMYSTVHSVDTGKSTIFHAPTQSDKVVDVGFVPLAAKDKHVFKNACPDVVDHKCPVEAPLVEVRYKLWQQWIQLARQFKIEWLAYLRGKKLPNGSYCITSMYFPPQIGSGAFVDVDDDFEPKSDTIGAVHSHVDMGVFWSGTDTGHSNWPVEIVVNSRGEDKVDLRHKVDCGRWFKNTTKLAYMGKRKEKVEELGIEPIVASLVAAMQLGDKLKAARIAKNRSEGQLKRRRNGKEKGSPPLSITKVEPVTPPAMVDTTTTTEPDILGRPPCTCGHSLSDHYDGKYGCKKYMDTEIEFGYRLCPCMRYVAQDNPPAPPMASLVESKEPDSPKPKIKRWSDRVRQALGFRGE